MLLIFGQPSILPSNQPSLGALPARFRRQRILVIGCGDVGTRVAKLLGPRAHLIALTSSANRLASLRALGIRPLKGNLDHAATLARLSGIATRVLHLAPPPNQGESDPRTLALLRALRRRSLPTQLVYGSTSGVYGDCAGAVIDETRSLAPATGRARRRVDAERQLRLWGRSSGVCTHVLRIPGIYANDREGATPRQRLAKGTPVLTAQDDVYTNHIHADDLARACIAALWKGRPQRTTHASDDTDLKMGDYFDLAADLYRMPRPPRISRLAAQSELPAMLLSFMGESRRLDNRRMKHELGLRLRYPTVRDGLA